MSKEYKNIIDYLEQKSINSDAIYDQNKSQDRNQLILLQQGRNNDPVLPCIDSSMQNLGKAMTAWG